MSLLILNCQLGHIKVVKALIKAGVDVNYQSTGGFTALMAACFNHKNDCVQLLIENKADVNLIDNDGMSALNFANIRHNEQGIQLLTDAGATVNLNPKEVLQLCITTNRKNSTG